MGVNETKEMILNKKTALGIEFGSTRIKAVLVDANNVPIASGSYDWENRLENGIWTYHLEDIHAGLQGSYKAHVPATLRQSWIWGIFMGITSPAMSCSRCSLCWAIPSTSPCPSSCLIWRSCFKHTARG